MFLTCYCVPPQFVLNEEEDEAAAVKNDEEKRKKTPEAEITLVILIWTQISTEIVVVSPHCVALEALRPVSLSLSRFLSSII